MVILRFKEAREEAEGETAPALRGTNGVVAEVPQFPLMNFHGEML